MCRTHAAAGCPATALRSAVSVLSMQGGFALLEAGSVRQENKSNIMLKNLYDMVLGILGWWIVGWGLAYGEDSGAGLFGVGQFVASDISSLANWTFQMSYAATAATIDSGAVAERMRFGPYLILSAITTSFIYPVVAHWVWNEGGWLAQRGFVDFAGSGVVHMLGGASALVCTIILGPRAGRFPPKRHAPQRYQKKGGDVGWRAQPKRAAVMPRPWKANSTAADVVKPAGDAQPGGATATILDAHADEKPGRDAEGPEQPTSGSEPRGVSAVETAAPAPGDKASVAEHAPSRPSGEGHTSSSGGPEDEAWLPCAHGPSDSTQLLFGTLLLWVNWYSFNTGSTLSALGHSAAVAAVVGVNTSLGAVGGGVAGATVSVLRFRHIRVEETSLSILGGLVSITAACHALPDWGALLVGFCGGLLACSTPPILERLRIDDPVGAFAVHCLPGALGCIAVGLLGVVSDCNGAENAYGLLTGAGAHQLGVQLMGICAILAWTTTLTAIVMLMLKHTLGIRVSPEEEAAGLDYSEHLVAKPRVDVIEIVAKSSVQLSGASKDGLRRRITLKPQAQDIVHEIGGRVASDDSVDLPAGDDQELGEANEHGVEVEVGHTGHEPFFMGAGASSVMRIHVRDEDEGAV